jgi:hypothetical protein
VSNSGWFSERSANYLASGKPVLLQDTGFSDLIETGNGVFKFQSKEDILEAMEMINSDYEKQCREARDIAGTFFDSASVLSSLLNRL